jgi:hypothetical protein
MAKRPKKVEIEVIVRVDQPRQNQVAAQVEISRGSIPYERFHRRYPAAQNFDILPF